MAVLGGKKLLAFAFHKSHLHQLFQNGSAGGRGSQTLALGVLRHILGPGPFYSRQKRVLGVGFRRRGEMLGNGSLHLVKGLALGDLRQFPRQLRRILVGVGLKASTETAVNLFPARRQDGFALGGKLVSGAGESGGDSLKHMGRCHGTKQFTAHKGEKFFSPSVIPSKPF